MKMEAIADLIKSVLGDRDFWFLNPEADGVFAGFLHLGNRTFMAEVLYSEQNGIAISLHYGIAELSGKISEITEKLKMANEEPFFRDQRGEKWMRMGLTEDQRHICIVAVIHPEESDGMMREQLLTKTSLMITNIEMNWPL
ncbi:MAG: hypothetical protein WC528_04230 [Patescibacteria group bacterium]